MCIFAVPSCKRKNEKYNDCGTACPLTCDNYNDDIACTRQCVQGCFCETGYVRNGDGDCVLPRECKPKGNCDNDKNSKPHSKKVNYVNQTIFTWKNSSETWQEDLEFDIKVS